MQWALHMTSNISVLADIYTDKFQLIYLCGRFIGKTLEETEISWFAAEKLLLNFKVTSETVSDPAEQLEEQLAASNADQLTM